MKLRHLLPLLALVLAPACKSNNDHESAIIVYVQSDLAIPTEIDRVRIRTTSANSRTPLHEYTFLLGQGAERVMLPVREGLYPTNDSQAAIRVETQALLGELVIVARTAVLSFVPGKKIVLDLSLLATCRDRSCSSGLTCGPNGCQPETVEVDKLPVYQPGLTPSSPLVDASVADGDVVDAGKDAPAASAEAGTDVAQGSELDGPEPTGTNTATRTGTGAGTTGTGLPTTGTSAGQTGTVTAATGTGTSLLTNTGSGATATKTAASATQTSVATQQTATDTGSTTRTGSGSGNSTGSGSGTGTGSSTATKTGTVTMIGTRSFTDLFTSIGSTTATLNVTVPSTATAIVTQTITDTATAMGTASQTTSLTQTSTAASTSTATSSAGTMAMTYLPLTKDNSQPMATDTSTSTQIVAGVIAYDQSGKYFCGTGIYEKTTACNAYMDYVAAGQASPFAPSSTRYQPTSGSNTRIYDCSWYPTPAGKLSISIWVKPSQLTGGKQSILAWNFGDVQLSIDANGNAACLPVGTSPANTIPLPLNQWTHLTCTQNATAWKLYLNDGTTSVTNTGPTTFRNPQPNPNVVNCLGAWYLSGWDLTNITDPCTANSAPPARFAGDLSTLRIYHDYTLSPLEVANLHLCNNTACTGTIVVTSTATASFTTTVPITITTTATATMVGTIPATTTDTATGTVSTIATSIGSTIETVVQTSTQTQAAHRLFGW